MDIKKKIAKNHCYIGANSPAYVVVHETDNWDRGAGAETHARALYNGNLGGSVHFYVDDHEIYQTLDIADGAYAVGDGGGRYGITNRNSINLEICVNPDSNYYKAVENAKWLCAKLLKERGWGIDRLKRHYDASRKNCPRRIIAEGLWDGFKADVQKLMNGTSSGSSAPAPKPETSKPAPGYSPIRRDGQIHLNNFTGAGIDIDGLYGPDTKKGGIMVLQTAINMDYRAGLAIDGILGAMTLQALGSHFVCRGECQYMVTALEILLMLKGYNTQVECPGSFGSGLEAAVRQYQKDHGLTVDGIAGRNTFMSLVA